MNGTIERFHHAVFVLAVGALFATAHNLSAITQGQDCSNLVIDRSFSQAFGEGFLNVPVNSPGAPASIGIVPTAGGGFITFLSGGKVQGQVTLALGLLGVMPDITFDKTSTYALSWDLTKTPAVCSGTVALNAPGESFHFQVRVVSDGRRIEMIHADPGVIVSVTAIPVETSGCTNRTLNGQYSYNAKGWSMAGGSLGFPANQMVAGYFPFSSSGVMEFNPGGQPRNLLDLDSDPVMNWATQSLNGTIVSGTSTGSYKVNANCTGTLALTNPNTGQWSHFEMFVGMHGNTLNLVSTDTVAGAPVPAAVYSPTLNRVGE
jgi:hypothetical protein